jgi:hypothetical protein
VNHYERLGVGPEADATEIKRAFRKAARIAHPDAGGSVSDFAALEEARRVLSSPGLRAAYDAELGEAEPWGLAGWGEEVGLDPRTGTWAAAPAGPDGGADRPVSDTGARPGEPDEMPDAPDFSGLRPYEAGAVRLPDVAEEVHRLREAAYRADGPTPRERYLFRAALASAVAWLGCVIAEGVVDADLLAQPLMAVMSVGVVYAVAVGALHKQRRRLGGGTVTAAVAVAATPVLTWLYFAGGGVTGEEVSAGPLDVAMTALMTLAMATGALATDCSAVRRRRRIKALTVAAQIELRHSLATSWNAVRAALEDPRARVCLVVRRRPYGANDIPIRVWDPDLQREVEVETATDLRHGDWVVLDGGGEMVCAAPAVAVRAWVGVLGLDAEMVGEYPGPGHHTARG